MKKALSLILVLVLCLSLCACGDGNDTSESKDSIEDSSTSEVTEPNNSQNTDPEPTEDPAIEAERAKKYDRALALLEIPYCASYSRPLEKAYNLFLELGDYKDAKEYLSRFTLLTNVLLEIGHSETNNFGDTYYYVVGMYCYDAQGRISYGPTAFWLTAVDPISYVEGIEYTYNDAGLLVEEVQGGSPGLKLRKTYYTYDDDGKLLQRDEITADTSLTCIYYYDTEGRLVKVASPESETPAPIAYESIYHYDANGMVILVEEKWGEWNDYFQGYSWSTTEYIYEYDESGNLVKEVIDVKSGSNNYTEITHFYENGVLTQSKLVAGYLDEPVVCDYTYGDYYCYTPAE